MKMLTGAQKAVSLMTASQEREGHFRYNDSCIVPHPVSRFSEVGQILHSF